MPTAHETLAQEVAERLPANKILIAEKREAAEKLRLEIKALKDEIEVDERLDRALNPKTKVAEAPIEATPDTPPPFVPQ